MIFDVRSGDIKERRWRRKLENALVPSNAAFFKNVTVISSGLSRHLRLPRRAHVLPLGADRPAALAAPRRDELKLLYVGTFTGRHIHRTVEGFADFALTKAGVMPCSFTIIGFGNEDDRRRIRETASSRGVEDRVEVLERVAHGELPEIFAEHNVGVAFTPQVPWFEHQPSTKLFEYLQSGLLCIATDNAANRELVSAANGVLVDDNAAGFCSGLEAITELLPTWRPEAVAEGVRDHTWKRIIEDNLAPYLRRVRRKG